MTTARDARLKNAVPIAAADALRDAAANCRECPLGERATQTVWGEGPGHPRLMMVGEQPGDREDRAGRPFVGPAGQLLERALVDLGWRRSELYVTNAVKHFKFEWRGKIRKHKTPGQLELLACQHWLDSEIDAIAPRAIVALGAVAARALLGRPVRVLAQRGSWLMRSDAIPVLITVHPSALLRVPSEQRHAHYAAWLGDLARAAKLPPKAAPDG